MCGGVVWQKIDHYKNIDHKKRLFVIIVRLKNIKIANRK